MVLTRYLWCRVATDEGIAGVTLGTHAGRCVIDHRALRQEAARARARIPALLSHAGLVRGTVRIDRALGSAIRRHADVILRATARWRVTNRSAQSVRSAR